MFRVTIERQSRADYAGITANLRVMAVAVNLFRSYKTHHRWDDAPKN